MNNFITIKNITDSWQKVDGLVLNIDLEAHSLNGVCIGEPIDNLSFLGESDFTENRDKSFVYGDMGLVVIRNNDLFSSLFIAVSKKVMRNRYLGEWLYEGKKIEISDNFKVHHVETLLGKPNDCWEDAMEKNYTYITNNISIEFSWSKKEKLQYIDFGRPRS